MKCRLKKIPHLSGNKASVYSVIIDQCQDTLFEVFLKENAELHMNELTNILLRIKTMGQKVGIIDDFLKIHEGRYGDGVCALYDVPNSNASEGKVMIPVSLTSFSAKIIAGS